MKKELFREHKWIIMLLIISILQGAIPTIYNTYGPSKMAIWVVLALVLVHAGSVVWLLLFFSRSATAKLGDEPCAKRKQIFLRIGIFVLIWSGLLLGLGRVHIGFVVSPYSIGQGFLEKNMLFLFRAFAFTVTLNMLYVVTYFIKLSTKKFWINTVKMITISFIPIYVVTVLAMLVTTRTGVFLDMIVTWLMWTGDIAIFIKIMNKACNRIME